MEEINYPKELTSQQIRKIVKKLFESLIDVQFLPDRIMIAQKLYVNILYQAKIESLKRPELACDVSCLLKHTVALLLEDIEHLTTLNRKSAIAEIIDMKEDHPESGDLLDEHISELK